MYYERAYHDTTSQYDFSLDFQALLRLLISFTSAIRWVLRENAYCGHLADQGDRLQWRASTDPAFAKSQWKKKEREETAPRMSVATEKMVFLSGNTPIYVFVPLIQNSSSQRKTRFSPFV